MATPSVSETAVSSIFAKEAKADALVSADGGATITERGFVYSKHPNPQA